MNTLIKICKKYDLTIPQLCYLYSRDEDFKRYSGRTQEDVHNLVTKGYLNVRMEPTAKVNKVLADIEHLFNPKKKLPKQLEDEKVDEYIIHYLNLWPAKVLPSGKPARASFKVIKESFKSFFKDYDYTWKEIIDATISYLEVQDKENYRSSRTSQYFIVKTQHGIKESVLADYCELIKDGVEHENYFKQKVV